MLRQPFRRVATTALCLSVAGCATICSFPKPMGGVRTHAALLGFGRSPARRFLAGLEPLVWVMVLPISVTDLTLSLGADLALLPILGPPAWIKAIREARRASWAERLAEERAAHEAARRPPPPTPEQVAMEDRRRAAERADRERAAAAKATVERVAGEAREAAAGDRDEERRVSGLLDRLFGSPQVVSRQEDTFIWLPESAPIVAAEDARLLGGLMDGAEALGAQPSGWIMAAHLAERRGDAGRAIELCNAALDRDPLQAPAWTVRGWARLRQGDLDRAEVDLALGEVLCLDPLNGAWATIGRGRVAEARGRRAQARLLYERVLGDPQLVRSLQRGVDHVSDLRRRVEELSGR